MLDVDTFLTALYVIADDFCQSRPREEDGGRPGPDAPLSDGEIVALAIFARWGRFASERDFYRYATDHLLDAFPALPERSQFNRCVRSRAALIERVAVHLAGEASRGAPDRPYQVLDTSAMPVRDAKRRGEGWLAGYADVGWSNRLGWYEGFRLLIAVDPVGVVTGFGFAPASANDRTLAETFFAARRSPHPRLASVGSAADVPYVADKGFEGERNLRRWAERYGARVIHAPRRNSRHRSWPRGLRRWVAGLRQIVETVYDKLLNSFALHRERPHELSGLRARLAARVALHNFCIWLNERLGRPRMAFADLLRW